MTLILMRIQINFKSGVPVYLQIVEQVKHAAASGALRAGDALPGIRPLAENVRVNRNTVAKAYAELESQGIIESLPGKGCFLTENHSPYKKKIREQLLTELIDAAIVQAHHFQIEDAEFLRLTEQRFHAFEKLNATADSSHQPRKE
ncbi:MAG: GntR family transcriptional regulator [Verrucomicrobiales bacterium]|jgi:GntR family transcriptional regulator